MLTRKVAKMEFEVGENVSLQHFFNNNLPGLEGHTFTHLAYFKRDSNIIHLHLFCTFDNLLHYLNLANHFCNADVKQFCF